MTGPVIQLFVNPRPLRRTRLRIAALRRAFERHGATVIPTESRAGRLEIDPRADQVCSAGGDGTLRHVVDAVRRSGRPIPVSAFPAGTINLLAMECGYPRDPDAFVRRALEEATRAPHFMALVGDIPMLVCASAGPDSHMVATVSPLTKKLIGRMAYVVAFARLLIRWPRATITLVHDGRHTECEAVYVAKGRYFAGSWSFAPDASVASPLLHVVALSEASRWRFLRFAWQLLLKRPVDEIDGVERFACHELRITGSAAMPLQADGDIVARLPADIRVSAEPMDFA